MKTRLLVLLAGIITLLLVACAGDGARSEGAAEIGSAATNNGPGVSTGVLSEICPAGLSAFRTEFLAHVQGEVCNTCHNGDNPSAPPWLVGQDEQMYLSVKNYVNFADIAHSRIDIRAGNRHCGGGCNEAMAGRMTTYLQKWWDAGESTCKQTTTLRSEPQPVPSALPHDRFVTMTWELSSVDVSLRGAQLQVEIRKFTDAQGPTPGSYMLRKPRFVSEQPFPIAVEGMRILNNRSFQEAANQFERVHAVVSPDVTTGSTLTYPVLSPEPLILVEEHPGTDELMISFNKLAQTDRRMCRAMDKFMGQVMPVVEARGCKNCHIPGATADVAASSRFDMSGDDQERCAKFLARTWTDPNVLPPLIQYPLFGRFEHPRIFIGSNNVLPDWSNWITAEWQ